jgi:hypothetical protein
MVFVSFLVLPTWQNLVKTCKRRLSVPPIGALRNRLSVIFFVLVVIIGCSSLGQVQTPEIRPLQPDVLPSGNGWWYARFRLNWPPNTDPIWYMDLYLAHQVILPLLQAHQKDIPLWRFHRRAARDGAGRQFSFIFYTSPGTARNIFQTLQSDPMAVNMKSGGVIDDIVFDDPTKLTRPNIEDTSDKNWPVSIQKAWPYYIMGVSQMWLNLIAQVADDDLKSDPPSSIEEMDTFYKQVNQTVTDLWQKQGRHAFMHHLNALFGYEPLIYIEKRYLTF